MKKEIRWKERTFPDYYKKKKEDDDEEEAANEKVKKVDQQIYKFFSYYR